MPDTPPGAVFRAPQVPALPVLNATDAATATDLLMGVLGIRRPEARNLVEQVTVRHPLTFIAAVTLHTPRQPRGWHAGANQWQLKATHGGCYQLTMLTADVPSRRRQAIGRDGTA